MDPTEIEKTVVFVDIFLMRVPLVAFAVLPVLLTAVSAFRNSETLGRPWAFVGAGIVSLYLLAVPFMYSAFFFGLGFGGGGAFVQVAPGAAPPSSFAPYVGPIRIYGSLAAFAAVAIVALRYLRTAFAT